MFRLQKLKNWTHSSVTDDKKELNVYQSFQDQISLINSKTEEYITELGSEDKRLLIEFNGDKIPISLLKIMSESLLKNKSLSIEERATQSAELNRLYYQKLKLLKDKIIELAVNETDNVYLTYIHSCIKIINKLLKEYSYLLAIQRAAITSIDNDGNLNAGEKLRVLKDNIDVRTAEINARLTIDSLKR